MNVRSVQRFPVWSFDPLRNMHLTNTVHYNVMYTENIVSRLNTTVQHMSRSSGADVGTSRTRACIVDELYSWQSVFAGDADVFGRQNSAQGTQLEYRHDPRG